MIVLDTNVLVYAIGDAHPLREPAQRVVRAVGSGAVRGTTTIEVLQEFLHVAARRRDRQLAARQAARYAATLAPILRAGEGELADALALFPARERLDAFDCLLATTVIAADATALVSADRAFAQIEGLPFVDLAGRELDRLLT